MEIEGGTWSSDARQLWVPTTLEKSVGTAVEAVRSQNCKKKKSTSRFEDLPLAVYYDGK